MKLWTVQTEKAFQRIQENGELHGDWRRVDRWFKDAYQWLCVEMEKIDIQLRGRPPVWAWTQRPDLRYSAYGKPGETLYLLEIDVPPDEVLVSNFGAWHCVLNHHFVVMTEEESDRQWKADNYSLADMEDSWQRIFDLDLVAGEKNYGDTCQATFPRIERGYIRRSKKFTAR